MTTEFTLDTRQLPEAQDWQVGKKYKIVLTVEQVGHNKHVDYRHSLSSPKEKEPPRTHSVTFRIISARAAK